MQKILYASIAVLVLGCNERDQENFKVEGSVKNVSAQTIYLEETALGNAQPVIIDSSQLQKDGKFELEAITKKTARVRTRCFCIIVQFTVLKFYLTKSRV